MRFTALSPSPNKKNANALCVAGVESGRGFGRRRKGRGIEERGYGTPAIRTPFCSYLSVRKFLIGRAIMSNLLTCIRKKQP